MKKILEKKYGNVKKIIMEIKILNFNLEYEYTSLLLIAKSIFSKEDEINFTLSFTYKFDNTYNPTPTGKVFFLELSRKKDLNSDFSSLKKINLSYLEVLVYSKQC